MRYGTGLQKSMARTQRCRSERMATRRRINKAAITLIAAISIFIITSHESHASQKAANIFIGDSRTVGMYFAVNGYKTGEDSREVKRFDKNGDFWYAKVATGYKYMKEEAVPGITPYVGENTRIFILFGVNDDNNIRRVEDYAAVLEEAAKKWKELGAKTYYVSVNPVDDRTVWYTGTMGYSTNWVEAWNEKVLNTFTWKDLSYIDSYTRIGNKLKLTDGVHYNQESSRKIYNYLLAYTKDTFIPIITTYSSENIMTVYPSESI